MTAALLQRPAGSCELRRELRFCFTIDVDWIPGSEKGLARLYGFCERYKLPVAAFVTGRFAQAYPDLIREAAGRGYEIGTHGWEHPQNREEDNYRAASYEQQKRWIALSSDAVCKACGVVPRAFRAPNLSVCETTLQVLEGLQYCLDSSVPARRFDLGYGRVSNPRYFMAPLRPYHPSPHNLAAEGSSPIIEVPPSAFVIPINMSALRVFGLGSVAWAARRLARRTPVIVFYAHPVEFEVPDGQQIPAGNPRRYQKGLGPHNLDLLARFVDYVLGLGYLPSSLTEVLPANRAGVRPHTAASPPVQGPECGGSQGKGR